MFSVSVLVPGQGKYHIRGMWKRQMAQRNKDLSKPESTSPPTCPPARPQLPADTEPWAAEAQQPRSDTACRPVWSNFPSNRFLISLKAQSSGSLAMSEDGECGLWEVYVQCGCPLTGLPHRPLSVPEKYEKVGWHLSVWCAQRVFLGCCVNRLKRGAGYKVNCSEGERV